MLVALVGATATGKSDLAVSLARALDGEVINADSMQLYRGMDIGTAKLSVAERHGIPHHLLDIWDVTKTASVAEYQVLAKNVIDDIQARGKVPVLAGGSGLYVRAALGDLSFPGTDETMRARLETELAAVGPESLHQRLMALDPRAAAAILPSNGRRIVRALEVIELSGRPFSATLPGYDEGRQAVQLGLSVDRPELDRRIEARVDRMWARGFEAEVRGLPRLREGKTASRALGYRQMLRFLDGDWTLEQAREETVRATRRFARRQESWFRRDPRVTWLSAVEGELTARALSLLSIPNARLTPPSRPVPSRSSRNRTGGSPPCSPRTAPSPCPPPACPACPGLSSLPRPRPPPWPSHIGRIRDARTGTNRTIDDSFSPYVPDPRHAGAHRPPPRPAHRQHQSRR